jgi:hypothetical protein
VIDSLSSAVRISLQPLSMLSLPFAWIEMDSSVLETEASRPASGRLLTSLLSSSCSTALATGRLEK